MSRSSGGMMKSLLLGVALLSALSFATIAGAQQQQQQQQTQQYTPTQYDQLQYEKHVEGRQFQQNLQMSGTNHSSSKAKKYREIQEKKEMRAALRYARWLNGIDQPKIQMLQSQQQ